MMLESMPIDCLKIDKTMIDDLEVNSKAKEILKYHDYQTNLFPSSLIQINYRVSDKHQLLLDNFQQNLDDINVIAKHLPL